MSHGELAYVVRPRVHKGGFVYKLIVQLTSFPQFISIFTKRIAAQVDLVS